MSELRDPINTAMHQFLVLNLQLDSNGKQEDIPAGHIERFSLTLQPYGHVCHIQFSAFGDDVEALFNAEDVLKTTLTFKSIDPATKAINEKPLLEIKGIVTDKCYKRMPYSNSGEALRIYEITIQDAAKATWEQHFPICIYVDQSMKEIFEKHVNPEITIKFDWDKLETKHPITAFSLPHKDWLPEEQQVSFYSFFFWYLHQENGILTYDYKSHEYSLKGKKAPPAGKPYVIPEWYVEPAICFKPPAIRFNNRKLKHTHDSVDKENKENPHAFKNVIRESMASDNYHRFPEHVYEDIKSTLVHKKNVVNIEFLMFDGTFPFDKMVPGSPVTFKGKDEGTWSSESCYKGKTFIVRSFYLHADKLTHSEPMPVHAPEFRLQAEAVLEETDEPYVIRPYFTPPVFPFAIQGKVFREGDDEDEQSTYKILDSEKAPLGQYEVEVPLIEDEKKLVVPFTPDFMAGQFYYPFTKGQHVELSVYFHTAKILRVSNWQDLVRLPQGIQGCQTVFASDGIDKYTLMRHEFEDGKNAVFTIKQSSSDSQTQTVIFKQDMISIVVEEEKKKSLSIVFDKTKNLSISLEDKSAGSTQQIVLDGQTITHTCKGSAGTSSILQKPDEISLTCKNLIVKADKVGYDIKDVFDMTAKNKVSFNTKLLEADAKSCNFG